MRHLPVIKLKPHADGLPVAELTRPALERAGFHLKESG